MKSNQPDIKIYATAHHKETIQEAYREGLIETMICYHCLLFLTVIIFFMCPGSTEPCISASVKRYYPQRLLYHRRWKHKTEIHEEVIRLGMEANFIGGHPMTGSEKQAY